MSVVRYGDGNGETEDKLCLEGDVIYRNGTTEEGEHRVSGVDFMKIARGSADEVTAAINKVIDFFVGSFGKDSTKNPYEAVPTVSFFKTLTLFFEAINFNKELKPIVIGGPDYTIPIKALLEFTGTQCKTSMKSKISGESDEQLNKAYSEFCSQLLASLNKFSIELADQQAMIVGLPTPLVDNDGTIETGELDCGVGITLTVEDNTPEPLRKNGVYIEGGVPLSAQVGIIRVDPAPALALALAPAPAPAPAPVDPAPAPVNPAPPPPPPAGTGVDMNRIRNLVFVYGPNGRFLGVKPLGGDGNVIDEKIELTLEEKEAMTELRATNGLEKVGRKTLVRNNGPNAYVGTLTYFKISGTQKINRDCMVDSLTDQQARIEYKDNKPEDNISLRDFRERVHTKLFNDEEGGKVDVVTDTEGDLEMLITALVATGAAKYPAEGQQKFLYYSESTHKYLTREQAYAMSGTPGKEHITVIPNLVQNPDYKNKFVHQGDIVDRGIESLASLILIRSIQCERLPDGSLKLDGNNDPTAQVNGSVLFNVGNHETGGGFGGKMQDDPKLQHLMMDMIREGTATTGRVLRDAPDHETCYSHTVLLKRALELMFKYLGEAGKEDGERDKERIIGELPFSSFELARQILKQGVGEELFSRVPSELGEFNDLKTAFKAEKEGVAGEEAGRQLINKIYTKLNSIHDGMGDDFSNFSNPDIIPPTVWQRLKIAIGDTEILRAMNPDAGDNEVCYVGGSETPIFIQRVPERGDDYNILFWEDCPGMGKIGTMENCNDEVCIGNNSFGHQAGNSVRVALDERGNIRSVCSDVHAQHKGRVCIRHGNKVITLGGATNYRSESTIESKVVLGGEYPVVIKEPSIAIIRDDGGVIVKPQKDPPIRVEVDWNAPGPLLAPGGGPALGPAPGPGGPKPKPSGPPAPGHGGPAPGHGRPPAPPAAAPPRRPDPAPPPAVAVIPPPPPAPARLPDPAPPPAVAPAAVAVIPPPPVAVQPIPNVDTVEVPAIGNTRNFSNSGNSCYFDVVIQVMMANRRFKEELLKRLAIIRNQRNHPWTNFYAHIGAFHAQCRNGLEARFTDFAAYLATKSIDPLDFARKFIIEELAKIALDIECGKRPIVTKELLLLCRFGAYVNNGNTISKSLEFLQGHQNSSKEPLNFICNLLNTEPGIGQYLPKRVDGQFYSFSIHAKKSTEQYTEEDRARMATQIGGARCAILYIGNKDAKDNNSTSGHYIELQRTGTEGEYIILDDTKRVGGEIKKGSFDKVLQDLLETNPCAAVTLVYPTTKDMEKLDYDLNGKINIPECFQRQIMQERGGNGVEPGKIVRLPQNDGNQGQQRIAHPPVVFIRPLNAGQAQQPVVQPVPAQQPPQPAKQLQQSYPTICREVQKSKIKAPGDNEILMVKPTFSQPIFYFPISKLFSRELDISIQAGFKKIMNEHRDVVYYTLDDKGDIKFYNENREIKAQITNYNADLKLVVVRIFKEIKDKVNKKQSIELYSHRDIKIETPPMTTDDVPGDGDDDERGVAVAPQPPAHGDDDERGVAVAPQPPAQQAQPVVAPQPNPAEEKKMFRDMVRILDGTIAPNVGKPKAAALDAEGGEDNDTAFALDYNNTFEVKNVDNFLNIKYHKDFLKEYIEANITTLAPGFTGETQDAINGIIEEWLYLFRNKSNFHPHHDDDSGIGDEELIDITTEEGIQILIDNPETRGNFFDDPPVAKNIIARQRQIFFHIQNEMELRDKAQKIKSRDFSIAIPQGVDHNSNIEDIIQALRAKEERALKDVNQEAQQGNRDDHVEDAEFLLVKRERKGYNDILGKYALSRNNREVIDGILTYERNTMEGVVNLFRGLIVMEDDGEVTLSNNPGVETTEQKIALVEVMLQDCVMGNMRYAKKSQINRLQASRLRVNQFEEAVSPVVGGCLKKNQESQEFKFGISVLNIIIASLNEKLNAVFNSIVVSDEQMMFVERITMVLTKVVFENIQSIPQKKLPQETIGLLNTLSGTLEKAVDNCNSNSNNNSEQLISNGGEVGENSACVKKEIMATNIMTRLLDFRLNDVTTGIFGKCKNDYFKKKTKGEGIGGWLFELSESQKTQQFRFFQEGVMSVGAGIMDVKQYAVYLKKVNLIKRFNDIPKAVDICTEDGISLVNRRIMDEFATQAGYVATALKSSNEINKLVQNGLPLTPFCLISPKDVKDDRKNASIRALYENFHSSVDLKLETFTGAMASCGEDFTKLFRVLCTCLDESRKYSVECEVGKVEKTQKKTKTEFCIEKMSNTVIPWFLANLKEKSFISNCRENKDIFNAALLSLKEIIQHCAIMVHQLGGEYGGIDIKRFTGGVTSLLGAFKKMCPPEQRPDLAVIIFNICGMGLRPNLIVGGVQEFAMEYLKEDKKEAQKQEAKKAEEERKEGAKRKVQELKRKEQEAKEKAKELEKKAQETKRKAREDLEVYVSGIIYEVEDEVVGEVDELTDSHRRDDFVDFLDGLDHYHRDRFDSVSSHPGKPDLSEADYSDSQDGGVDGGVVGLLDDLDHTDNSGDIFNVSMTEAEAEDFLDGHGSIHPKKSVSSHPKKPDSSKADYSDSQDETSVSSRKSSSSGHPRKPDSSEDEVSDSKDESSESSESSSKTDKPDSSGSSDKTEPTATSGNSDGQTAETGRKPGWFKRKIKKPSKPLSESSAQVSSDGTSAEVGSSESSNTPKTTPSLSLSTSQSGTQTSSPAQTPSQPESVTPVINVSFPSPLLFQPSYAIEVKKRHDQQKAQQSASVTNTTLSPVVITPQEKAIAKANEIPPNEPIPQEVTKDLPSSYLTLRVKDFALSRLFDGDSGATLATPATPATPTTPATPATPATPVVNPVLISPTVLSLCSSNYDAAVIPLSSEEQKVLGDSLKEAALQNAQNGLVQTKDVASRMDGCTIYAKNGGCKMFPQTFSEEEKRELAQWAIKLFANSMSQQRIKHGGIVPTGTGESIFKRLEKALATFTERGYSSKDCITLVAALVESNTTVELFPSKKSGDLYDRWSSLPKDGAQLLEIRKKGNILEYFKRKNTSQAVVTPQQAAELAQKQADAEEKFRREEEARRQAEQRILELEAEVGRLRRKQELEEQRRDIEAAASGIDRATHQGGVAVGGIPG